MSTRTAKARAAHVAVIAVVVAALAAVTSVVHRQTDDPLLIGYWWFGALVITFCLVTFLIGRRYLDREPAVGRVLAIVPAYNEDRANIEASVRALIAQTVDVDIEVIDDGSTIPLLPFENPRVTWRRQPNTGKRGAQVEVLKSHGRQVAGRWRSSTYAFIVTVDSDSRPAPDAVEHLLRAMADQRVQAATGWIYTKNYRDSLVARAADLDIGTSCVMMRASRSILGCLETTSGALAMYRADLLYDHLEAYAVECGTGDDRWLALRALERGQVVGVAEALVETDMPTTLRGTYRQRLRWARSWWWMLPYVFRNLNWRQLISPTYGMLQLVIAPLLTLWALAGVVLGEVTGHARYGGRALMTLAVYLIAYVIVRWGLSALYLVGRPGMSVGQKWISFLGGTPAAILLNLFLLTPTRYLALAKLSDNRWRTRTSTATPAAGTSEHDHHAVPTMIMARPAVPARTPWPCPVPAVRQPAQYAPGRWSPQHTEATSVLSNAGGHHTLDLPDEAEPSGRHHIENVSTRRHDFAALRARLSAEDNT